MVDIVCSFTTPDGDYAGACYADYFRDRGLKLAGLAKTKSAAEHILRNSYLGPDVDGIGVTWDVFES